MTLFTTILLVGPCILAHFVSKANNDRWMKLPKIMSDECFMLSDKESLAVGTEVLVFGREIMAPAIYKYNILTNAWSVGKAMNTPRCLFGSANLGKIGILANGCDPCGKILSSAELYNSNTRKWETLPNLNTARKMCSSVFMDGKFYVLGGVAVDNRTLLTHGKEFDLKTRKWRKIPGIYFAQYGEGGVPSAPPSIAVVDNVLYVADHAHQELKRYVKDNNSWVTIGRLPEKGTSINGWGLAFQACGDQLIVIGGHGFLGRAVIKANGWVPNEGPPQWNLLARRHSGNFVYTCTVMGC